MSCVQSGGPLLVIADRGTPCCSIYPSQLLSSLGFEVTMTQQSITITALSLALSVVLLSSSVSLVIAGSTAFSSPLERASDAAVHPPLKNFETGFQVFLSHLRTGESSVVSASVKREAPSRDEVSSITLSVVGGLILVKKGGALVLTLGKGLSAIGGVAGGIEAISKIKSYFEDNEEEVVRLVDMSYDMLFDYCHSNGGGMVSTTDVTENSWGDSYIFGVPDKNAVCVAN